MSGDAAVRQHYAQPGIETLILDAFKAFGRSPETLTVDDLSVVDEFHMGGRTVTEEIAEALQLQPAHRVLDIGSGLGGPARYFARRCGCRVTGVDLTPDYVDAANALTRRVGLADRVDFQVASAVALPFEPARFDAATLIHVGMNVADKDWLCAQTARVLRRNGHFVIYDVMRVDAGDLAYPVAWAAGPETSFMATRETYREALANAGFVVIRERDRTGIALDVFRRFQARVAERGLPPLGLHLLMGPDTPTKVRNMLAALEGGAIAPILMVAVRG